VLDGAAGAVGGADGVLEGPLGGLGTCGVVGPLTGTLSGLGASVVWDETAAGGIAGGSIR
jgi:hypothetical protein